MFIFVSIERLVFIVETNTVNAKASCHTRQSALNWMWQQQAGRSCVAHSVAYKHFGRMDSTIILTIIKIIIVTTNDIIRTGYCANEPTKTTAMAAAASRIAIKTFTKKNE